MASTGVSVWPFSQFKTVRAFAPRRHAASFWLSLRWRRRSLRCSPRVRGSKSVSFGFNALSLMGTNCKRATRPCPCGHCGDRSGRCRCTPERIARYRGRISGPLADRIDIKLEVPAPREAELVAPIAGEASSEIAKRVARAREVQLARQGTPNALLGTRDIDRHCGTDRDGDQLLRHALARLLLSARAYHRVLRVARSIADLAGKVTIAAEHIAEAIQYRRLDASF